MIIGIVHFQEMSKENIWEKIKVVVVRRNLAEKVKSEKVKHWKFTGEGRM